MKKLRSIGLALGAGLLAMSADGAHAATLMNFTSFDVVPNPGEAMVTDFETPLGGGLAGVLFDLAGFALSGDAALLTGSSSLGAAPAMSSTTRDTTQYLSLEKGQFADLSTPLLHSISFYVGSLDQYNGVAFTHQNGTVETIWGSTLAGLLTQVDANGNQQAANSNGRLSFVFDDPVTSVHLMSTSNSFEISNIAAAVVGAVPEPTGWSLIILGFGGAGVLLRRQRGKGRVLAKV